MKPSTLARNGVSSEMVELIGRLIDSIAWPARRRAMGDVTLALLDGKQRVAENVFGWNRRSVELGLHEYQTGIACVNVVSTRGRPKAENKEPQLLAEIQAIMESHSQAQLPPGTSLQHAKMTARKVHEALVQKGGSAATLPSVRTISNLLNRQDCRLLAVVKSTTQKNPVKPRLSLPSKAAATL